MARPFLAVVLLGAATLLGGCKKRDAIEMIQPPAVSTALPKHWTLPEFALTERSGQTVHLSDLAGKVWVADFFYTTCPGPCPMLTSRFSDVQKALGAEPEVRLVSISVDPEKDTTEVLKAYAERFKAGERWLFLTGRKDNVFSLARDGFKLPVAEATVEGAPIIHTTRLILVDKAGNVRGFYEGATEVGVQEVIRDIRRLLKEK